MEADRDENNNDLKRKKKNIFFLYFCSEFNLKFYIYIIFS